MLGPQVISTLAPFRRANLFYLRAVVLLFAGSAYVGTSEAAYVYTFAGQIPTDTTPQSAPLIDTHPFIEPGETWLATLIIEESTPQGYTEPTNAIYAGAVIRGSLIFSGGYVAPYDYAGAHIQVINDVLNKYDSIQLMAVLGPEYGTGIQAFTDRNSVPSLSLPEPGARVLPSPSHTMGDFLQLHYRDTFGAIRYNTDLSNNVSFTAFVPEPTSLTFASLLGGSFVLARRRRS